MGCEQELEVYKSVFTCIYSKDKPNLEETLKALREAGASMGKSAWVLKQMLGLSLKEVDHIVLYSDVWEDHRESSILFREMFAEVVESQTS